MPGALAPPASAQGRAWGARIQGGSAVGTVLTALMPANVSATTVQWTRNGTDIPGATGPTYTTTDTDGGKAISYRYVPVVAAGVSVVVGAVIAANLEKNAIAAARRNGAALWYIPDSLAGVYQDSAGTTLPALNAPIGLLLDRSYGAETLGPDALNGIGAFDSATGWTGGGGWTVAGGVATNSGVSADLTAAINVVKGRQYVVSFRLTSYTAGANAPGIHNGVGAFIRASISRYSALGTCTEVLTATADGATTIVINAASPCSIDELTVREVAPLAANLGPELVTNGGFDDSSWWTADTGWSISGGIASKSSGSGSLRRAGLLTVGKTYRIAWDSLFAAGPLNVIAGSTYASFSATTVGRMSCNVAAASNGDFQFQGGGNYQIDNVSIREVLGYHATQATAANKPTLVRVPRKLGPNIVTNGDFSNGASGWPNSSVGSGTFTVTGGVANFSYTDTSNYGKTVANAPTEAGKSYYLSGNVVSGVAYVGVVGAGGNMAGRFSRTTVASGPSTYIQIQSVSGNTSVDDIEIREVLEWGYAFNFDRVNDVLGTSVLCGDAGTIIASHQVSTVTGAWQALAGTGSAPTTTSRGARLRVGTATPPNAGVDVAWPATSSFVNSGGLSTATAVQSGSWDATAIRGHLGGVQAGSATASAGIGNGQPFFLGALNASGADGFSGAISLLCIAPVVLPDADRIAIERFGAYLNGSAHVG